jgi:hypothetical protein
MERSGIAAHIKDPANRRIITRLSKLMPVSEWWQLPVTGPKSPHDEFVMFLNLDAGAPNLLSSCRRLEILPPTGGENQASEWIKLVVLE